MVPGRFCRWAQTDHRGHGKAERVLLLTAEEKSEGFQVQGRFYEKNPTSNVKTVSCKVCCEGSRRKPMAQSYKRALDAKKGPGLTAGQGKSSNRVDSTKT